LSDARISDKPNEMEDAMGTGDVGGEVAMNETSADPVVTRITLGGLFMGFLSVGLRGFGGVLPWARLMIVEECRWLTGPEFTELLSICQILPGPNIVNVSISIGARFRGVAGAVAAFAGLMTMPLIIVLSLGALYERFGRLSIVDPVFHNLGAAAAGLVIGTGIKMATTQWRKPLSVLVALAAFAAVAWFRWPLILVVLGLAPLSLFAHWRLGR
jgi:chromate transporter